ncbi:MAG: hypothetical protein ACI9IV_001140 [Paracoccaceae bacterium]|jgi:hypothetical protein
MSSWAATRYKTKNWSSYNESLKQRESLSIWFDPEMVWKPPPSNKRGRRQQFSDAAPQTCLTLKVLFCMPLRQTTGFVQSLLRLAGLDRATPDFSTLCRLQKTLNVSLPNRGSKHRVWRKIPIGIDEETLKVRAVEVTGSNIGDAPMHCRAVNERQSYCPKRRGQCAAIPWAHFVATLEWISPPKPCRNEDALYKTARPIVDGAGLRAAGRGNPNPHRGAEPLHGPWHTSYRGRRISPSGEWGRTSFTRSVQLNRLGFVGDRQLK